MKWTVTWTQPVEAVTFADVDVSNLIAGLCREGRDNALKYNHRGIIKVCLS